MKRNIRGCQYFMTNPFHQINDYVWFRLKVFIVYYITILWIVAQSLTSVFFPLYSIICWTLPAVIIIYAAQSIQNFWLAIIWFCSLYAYNACYTWVYNNNNNINNSNNNNNNVYNYTLILQLRVFASTIYIRRVHLVGFFSLSTPRRRKFFFIIINLYLYYIGSMRRTQ